MDTCNWDTSVNRWTRFTQNTFAWLTGSPTASLVRKGLLGVGLLLLVGLLLRAAASPTRIRWVGHLRSYGPLLAPAHWRDGSDHRAVN